MKFSHQTRDHHLTAQCGSSYQRSSAYAAIAFATLLVAACGQASPQGLDDLSARPSFGRLTIYPQDPTVETGKSVQFELRNETNSPLDGPVIWSATGGTITREGRYTAGSTSGTYKVTAKLRSSVTVQEVSVISNTTASPAPDSDPEPSDSDDASPTTDSSDSDDDSSNSVDEPSDSGTGESLFTDGFESNDFRQWGGWAPLGDPTANGKGDGGAHIGEGYITNEMARNGSYAWRAQVDPDTPQSDPQWPTGKSSLERWRVTSGERDFTVSAWYYFPTNYPSGVWSNIMQIKQGGPVEYDPPAVIGINKDRKLILFEGLTDKAVVISSTVMPLGRWVELKTRFVIDRTNGRVTTWLDGRLVFDVTGMNTLGDSTTTDVYFGVGNYLTSKTATRCHVYIDDVRVTR